MKNFLHILLLAMVVCCWSCSGGGGDVPTPTPTPKPENNKIEISSSSLVVGQKGGTDIISFTTNAAWTANIGTSTSWLKVSPTSGAAGSHTLTITTEENNTYDERNATLTIKAGNASQNITVTQKQKDGLTVTSNKVEVGADGGDFSIEAKANVSVTFEIEESAKEWITASESRGLTAKTLKFNAKANDKIERRQGNIILKGGDGLTETVTVYQAGEEVSLVLTTEKDMTIGSEGGTLKIELQSNSEIKMEELDADWLRQSSSRAMSAYTYYFEVDANKTYDERNASITFVSGDKKQTVTVTQKQMDALIVNSNKVEVGVKGGNFSVETKANVSVTFEIEEAAKNWITASESRGLTAKTLNFTAKTNDKTERRQGNIILKGGDGLTETVTVYQAGTKPTIVLTQNEYTVASEGETIKVELKSNVNYDIQLPSVDWIKESSSRAMSVATHYFEVASNEGYDARSAEILFVNKDNDLSEKVTINQMQKDVIIVAKNEYTVDAAGGELKFEVNTNVDFKVETSVDWIKQNTESRGLEAKPLSFTIAENTADEAREGVITISSGDLKQEIKVIQKAKSVFSISKTEFKVAYIGGDINVEISTNGEYTITLPKVDWLKEAASRATSSYKHTFSISANETYDAREAEIVFTHKETSEVLKVKVAQAQKDAIIVAKNEYTVDAAGGDLKLEVNTNVDFKVETSVNWIKQNTKSRGLEVKPLSFNIAENTADEAREGLISITSGDLKQEIKVIQKGTFKKGTGAELEPGGGIEEG